jgi:DNA (cytosine-5)-methyltransferase 1
MTLLPTPRATEMEERPESFAARQTRMAEAGRTRGDSGMPLNVAISLLPTPAVNDMGRAYTPEEWDAWCATQQAKHGNGNGHGKSLEIEAQRLLPTPVATDAFASGNRPTDKASHPGTSLTDATVRGQGYMGRPHDTNEWGDYAPAIARWERVMGRPAPAPTEPGPSGNHRLSPLLTEWMMGLPAGWITDVPEITRNEALKLCGNGVVPQQAAAAIRFLLNTQAVAA